MAQICPAKSTIVPFKKQMYSSGSIILSYKDDKCICVSIHAPTRGATCQQESFVSKLEVSIHAPTRGATVVFTFKNHAFVFQSTHPRGVRRFVPRFSGYKFKFQSTHPRGVRLVEHVFVYPNHKFQSTHPRGVRQLTEFKGTPAASFNPRTHEGCDVQLFKRFRLDFVSIHAPTRGATSLCNLSSWSKKVSIHAPTRGATIS